jgi:hypothetical protein
MQQKYARKAWYKTMEQTDARNRCEKLMQYTQAINGGNIGIRDRYLPLLSAIGISHRYTLLVSTKWIRQGYPICCLSVLMLHCYKAVISGITITQC